MSFQEDFFKKHDYYEIIIRLLQRRESVEIELTGLCMKPLLQEKDLITIKPIAVSQLNCGDIVLYHINGRLKCHRFLKFKKGVNENQYLITKSDRRIGYDPPVSPDNFLGIIVRTKRGARILNYETKKWKVINFCLGKTSPLISKVEYQSNLLIHNSRIFASKLFRLITGTNFREFIKKQNTLNN